MIASGASTPESIRASSRLGRNQSHCAIVATMTARARASGHSLSRRLGSKATRPPAARTASIAAKTASQAVAEIAWLIADTCSTFAARSTASGSVAGVIRAAAEPARRYENSCPCAPWVTK